ncbi:MAG: hypothetical protein ACXVAX_08650 [Pseudobdellovibrio sp.]
MKKFLAIYLGSDSGDMLKQWESLSEEARKKKITEGVAAWGQWVEKNKTSIVETGSPLGRTMSAGKAGVQTTKNKMTAYTIVQAETHEEATKMFLNHPHYTIFPGDSIEVMECLPLPTA